MENIIISGGKRLKGEIDIQGSKNSSLPILASCVLVNGVSVIHNCPVLSDTQAAIKILEYLGCNIKRENNALIVDSRFISCYNIPESLMRRMRSSIVFLGALLGRMGIAELSSPGGCDIGLRPIDLHLNSFKALGVTIDESHGTVHCKKGSKTTDTVISLSFPSVGATENIMLLSCTLKGRTVILNAAREPEISDLADFLNSAGAKITIGKHGTVTVDGVDFLHSTEHTVIPDRICALTYLCSACCVGGKVLLKNTDTSSYQSELSVLQSAGAKIKNYKDKIEIEQNKRPSALPDIRTMPYPGFPTDAQALIMAVAAKAKGTSIIVENIFENRFKHVGELQRMGAKIKIEGRVALIDGVERLYGASVVSPDLRGGAALVVAGLSAEGTTTVKDVYHIDRGYEKIEQCFKLLGADIERKTVRRDINE